MEDNKTVSVAEVVAQPIGQEQLRQANLTLQKYKEGKANLEQRVIDNEEWYRLRHWECLRGKKKQQVEPVSAWLLNAIANKHADAIWTRSSSVQGGARRSDSDPLRKGDTMKYFFMMAMNLQLFADVTNATTSASSGNNLSAEMKTFYDKVLLREAGPNLVHEQFGQKRDIPRGSGKTIEFRKFNQLPKALTALTEGVTPDGGALDVTSLTATVAQYGYFVRITDMLDLTAIDNVIVEAVQLLGSQAGVTMDTIVRNALVSGTNVMYCPKVAGGNETAVTTRGGMDSTSQLTVKMVQKAAALLKKNNVPTINGKYVAIIHPYVAYDLMRDSEWVDAHKYAQPTNLYTGEIGEIAGVRFVESTEAKVWNDSNCPQIGSSGKYYSVFATLFLGKNAYGVTEVTGGGLQTIVKAKGSGGTSDPLDQRSTVGWKGIRNAKILLEQNMVRVESISAEWSESTAAN